MDKVIKAVETRKCVGCGNCLSACPTSAISFSHINGFVYPAIDQQKCIRCGKCDRGCPVNGDEIQLSTPVAFYAAYVEHSVMYPESTSGGVCAFASEEVIRRGGVVFSVMYANDWSAVYSKVENLDQLKKHVGSKYMQADPNNVQRSILKELKDDKQVLLIGTPCFVSAVKKYLNVNHIDAQKLITIDFLCHGVPSAEIASAFIRSLEKNNRKLEKYNFRSKKGGWGKLRRSTKFEGKEEKAIRADFCPLHGWFGKHLSIRESCFACDYRSVNRSSDITVADFWKIERYYPDFPLQQGVSAVQINSACGEKFYENLVNTGKVVSKPVSKESIWKHRKTAEKNFAKPQEYECFWDEWGRNGLKGVMRKYPPKSLISLICDKVKSLLR